MINKTHYVSVIPAWLAEQLAVIGTDIRITNDLNQLSTIVSAADVSFYYLYNIKASEYLGDTFADLVPFYQTPGNLNWISENAEVIAKAQHEFETAFHKAKGKLSDEGANQLVRKTLYQPKAILDNTLALVGFTSEHPYPQGQFYRDCCSELNKQILFEQYKKFAVFKEFTRHA